MKANVFYYRVKFSNKKREVNYTSYDPMKVGSTYYSSKGSFIVIGFIGSCSDSDIVERGELFDKYGSFI